MARFGKNAVMQSDWSPDEFAKMQQRLVEEYPRVVQQIGQLVVEIAQLISELPADQLLHRAWWEMVEKHTKIKFESEMGMDEAISVRMAVTPHPGPLLVRRGEGEIFWGRLPRVVAALNPGLISFAPLGRSNSCDLCLSWLKIWDSCNSSLRIRVYPCPFRLRLASARQAVVKN